MDNQSLIERLLAADNSKAASANLVAAGYWDDPTAWQPYGGSQANYGIVANQQSDPVGALVEKLVNSIDAILLLNCRLKGIEPNSPEAAQNMQQAVADYMGLAGPIHTWSEAQRQQTAEQLSVIISGNSATPTIDVVDRGEGQHPQDFPATFVSLNLVRKSRIPFVQGRYNMGSTGVLTFLGGDQLQLIVSRRHPDLGGGPWGATVVRRRYLADSGQSIWEYLAPGGQVLGWEAPEMALLPAQVEDKIFRPAQVPVTWGTLVRMWDYQEGPEPVIWGTKTSWKAMLEAMLPKMPIPGEIWDCRSINDGESNPRRDLLLGASLRSGTKLQNKETEANKVLSDSDSSSSESKVVAVSYEGRIRNCRVVVDAHYTDRPDSLYTFHQPNPLQAGYGPLFYTVNGQTHSFEDFSFFSREEISHLSSLQHGIMVYVDLTELKDNRSFSKEVEDLFMASRDRPRNSELFREIQMEVAQLLGRSGELAALAKQLRVRRKQASAEQSSESRHTLTMMIRHIFLRPSSASSGSSHVSGEEQTVRKRALEGSSPDRSVEGSSPEELQKFPSFWYLDDPNPEENDIPVLKALEGHSPLARFITDAQSDYFTRDDQPGSLTVSVVIDDGRMVPIEAIPNRHQDGFEVELPSLDKVRSGDQVICRAVVTDPRRESDPLLEPWVCTWIFEPVKPPPLPLLDMFDLPDEPRWSWVPEVRMVDELSWDEHGFTDYSGADIEEDDKGLTVYVNVDNRFLRNAMESMDSDAEVQLLQDTYCNLMAVHSTVSWRYTKMGNSRRDPAKRADPLMWSKYDSHKNAPAIVAAAVLHVRGEAL